MKLNSQSIARALLAHPRILILVLVVAVGAGAATGPGIDFVAGLDVYFDRDDPLQGDVDAIEDRFVNDDLLFVVYEHADVFSRDSLRSIRALSRKIEAIEVTAAPGSKNSDRVPAVADVHSLTTVDDLVGSNFNFRNLPLVPAPMPTVASELEKIRTRARANPLIVRTLLGGKDDAATVIVRISPALTDHQKAETVATVRTLLANTKADAPTTTYQLVGAAVTESDLVSFQQKDLARFIPIVTGLMACFLFFFFRRTRGVAVALCALGICVGAAMAALALMEGSFNNTSVMIPPLIMALTVAILIHYFTEYAKHGKSVPPAPAAHHTLASLLTPVAMASLTTAVGFACLRVSDVPALRSFGTVAAVAMLLAAVLATFTVAVCFRRWAPAELVSSRGFALSTGLDTTLTRLAAMVIKRRRLVFGFSVLVVVFLALGITRINADQSDLMFFDSSTPLRRANATMESKIGGSTTLVAVVRAPDGRSFTDPGELSKLQALDTFLVAELGADSAVSIVDFVKLMHREFLGGEQAEHRIPDTEQQVAQLLLLNTDTTVDEYLDESRRWVRVVARTKEHHSAQLVADYGRLDQYLADKFPAADGYEVLAASNSRLTASMVENLVTSQVQSLGASALFIFVLMFVMLRSVRLGLHSIAPNVFPIVVNLGLMGWLGVELNAATVMISTVALGIAVDDTVHFLQFLRVRLAAHSDLERGLAETIRTKGPAIIGTSVVISAGFAVMLLSDFAPTRDFAMLMCITMGAAIVGDLLLLPAFMLVLRRSPNIAAAARAAAGDHVEVPAATDSPAHVSAVSVSYPARSNS